MDLQEKLQKKMLLIINPVSGKKNVLRMITEIIGIFQDAGFLCTVMTTKRSGDASEFVRLYAKDFDRIVVAGGDGTLNEAVTGLVSIDDHTPLGYIPCGSTNDFARSLELSSDILEAARAAAGDRITDLDIGRFGDQYFSYVAAFGAFTDVTYSTNQTAKNIIGHTAYILDGLTTLSRFHTINMVIHANGQTFTGDYIFGAICNSTSVAGFLSLPGNTVDMRDGLFELLLVQAPDNPMDLNNIINGLLHKDYSSEYITFLQTPEIVIENPDHEEFTLDGERSRVYDPIRITMLPRFLKLIH